MRKKLRPVRKIKKRCCFRKILSLQHNRLTSEYFFLYYNASDYPEVGIQIGKRYLKKATSRNDLKRMISEYLRIHQETLPLMRIVIGVRKNIDEVERAKVNMCFYYLMEKFIELCE